jgi:hypothetical protein
VGGVRGAAAAAVVPASVSPTAKLGPSAFSDVDSSESPTTLTGAAGGGAAGWGARGAGEARRSAILGGLGREGATPAVTVGRGAVGGDTSWTCTVIRVEVRATGGATRVRQTATARTA